MFFSVVVPVFNREAEILRCVASVLAQRFRDFEIVLVDDGSTDASLARMRAAGDSRIRVLTHGCNRGVCPARNTGIAAARGRWVVLLDSDDELASTEALGRMHALAAAAPDGIAALWFRCRLDDGRLSPDRMPGAAEWDYRGYVGFLEATFGRPRDMIRCVRRACFEQILYPENRMLEDTFHLDFARRFRSRAYPDVLRLYHQDAANQLVVQVGKLDPVRDAAFLRDRADGMRDLLRAHGAALREIAPRVHRDYLARACTQSLLAGRRGSAVASALRMAAAAPAWPRSWALLAAALAGPAAARRVRAALPGAQCTAEVVGTMAVPPVGLLRM
jgi:glycosyltransferase involved in cell wall biosynthesis